MLSISQLHQNQQRCLRIVRFSLSLSSIKFHRFNNRTLASRGARWYDNKSFPFGTNYIFRHKKLCFKA
jgi:hypothetical protein